jgi:hypothetical protein
MSFKESIFYKVFSAILAFYAALLVLAFGIGLVLLVLRLFGVL